MKKIKLLCIFMAGILLLGFSSCTSQSNNNSGETEEVTESSEETSVDDNKENENMGGNNENNSGGKPTVPIGTPITVACIGDSITYGQGLLDPDTQSYPAQLQNALGEQYKVLNWGKSGSTMCSTSANIYKSKNWFKWSGFKSTLETEAKNVDVAFIMLGTNDANVYNNADVGALFSTGLDTFKADYKANLTQFVNTFRSANPDVVIYLMSSPKCFRPEDNYSAWEPNLQNVVRPYQKQLAEELDLEWYDMYSFSANTLLNMGFYDNLHPGMEACQKIGWELAGVLATRFGTEVMPKEAAQFSQSDNFDSLQNDITVTKSGIVTVGDSQLKVTLGTGVSEVTLNADNGILALNNTASKPSTYDFMLENIIYEGKYRMEIEVKASADLNTRGCFFFIFGQQFARFSADKKIVNAKNENQVLGELATDKFVKLAVDVDTQNETYVLYIDNQEVLTGSFEYKEGLYLRPVQFFSAGDGTIWLDSYSITPIE